MKKSPVKTLKKPKAKQPKSAKHDCFVKFDAFLAEYNTQLVTGIFNPEAIFIATMKVDSKKRGKEKLVLASHCPFCGRKLDTSKSIL
jgi:hypothetical protein